ncbi:MAG: c-type cytochrome [bacterium]|nr:c-type cytochrome [bacterium]
MHFFRFAGQFAIALIISILGIYAISVLVDVAYDPTGSSEIIQANNTGDKMAAAPSKQASQPVEVAKPVPAVANTPTQATTPVAAAKPKKKKRHPGRKIYLRKGACAACHGRKGQRAISYYPAIAGQDKKYMIAQIKDIMSGKRKGGIDADTGHHRTESMRGALVNPEGAFRITNDDIVQLASWLKDLPPAKPKIPETPYPAENIATGKKLFKKCVSCHGKEGRKPLKGYPFIAGQKREYIFMQLVDIRDKARSNGKSKLMLPFVKKLSNEQIAMIAEYLSQIDRSKK